MTLKGEYLNKNYYNKRVCIIITNLQTLVLKFLNNIRKNTSSYQSYKFQSSITFTLISPTIPSIKQSINAT